MHGNLRGDRRFPERITPIAAAPLHLDWPDCLNARDLGGTATLDGGSIRPGALIRSDNHNRLTGAGKAALHAAGVSRILDLRAPVECEADPSPFAGDRELYRNVPLQDPHYPRNDDGDTLPEVYAYMLDRNPVLFAAAMDELAGAPPGAVVIHCHAGKDRTGIVAALALTLAGVGPEAIGDDYELSAERRRELALAELARIEDPARRDFMYPRMFVRSAYMLDTLTHLDRTYGGVRPYLEKAGFSDAGITAVRERLRA